MKTLLEIENRYLCTLQHDDISVPDGVHVFKVQLNSMIK